MKQTDKKEQQSKKNEQDDVPGYPLYPENEDIYEQQKEETAPLIAIMAKSIKCSIYPSKLG